MSKTKTAELRIAYLNVRGFTMEKFDYVTSLFELGHHIIFVSETWFVNQSQYQPSPLFLVSSPYPTRMLTTGHPPGGIMAFVKPSIRHMVSSFSATSTYISITAFGLTIYAVYLPSSLSVSEFSVQMPDNTIPVLIGDINTRFGQSFQDSTSGPKDRLTFFVNF
jgi:hypothetical protein